MTCIVGVTFGGDVWMGGDSAGVAGLDVIVRADPKVFRVGEYLIGFTSSFRMGQLLRFQLDVPKQKDKHDDDRHMMTTFIDAVRQTLKDGGYAKVENSVEEGGTFLVGYRGRLYQIESDFQVGIALDGYDAVGCGADFALGALAINQHLHPKTRVEQALRVATQFSGGVRPPYIIDRITKGAP